MNTPPHELSVAELVSQLDAATTKPGSVARCDAVKTVLQELVGSGARLGEEWVRPVESGYARRLLHNDPDNRYSVVVMSWGPGQGTSIHDHSGLWCVECVCRGRILVKSYRLTDGLNVQGELSEERVRFAHEADVVAGIGEAGALIPPFDYHVIENPYDEPAATIHVYGGEMNTCRVFEPQPDGSHRPLTRQLSYS